jgi:hypothetical protein
MFQKYVGVMNNNMEAEQILGAETCDTDEVTEVCMEVISPVNDAAQNWKYKQSTSPQAPF